MFKNLWVCFLFTGFAQTSGTELRIEDVLERCKQGMHLESVEVDMLVKSDDPKVPLTLFMLIRYQRYHKYSDVITARSQTGGNLDSHNLALINKNVDRNLTEIQKLIASLDAYLGPITLEPGSTNYPTITKSSE